MKKFILPFTLLALGISVLLLGKNAFFPKTWSTPKAAYQDYLYKRGLVNFFEKNTIIPAKSAKSIECSVLNESADTTIQTVSEFKSNKESNKVKSVYVASKESKDTLFISQHLTKNNIELSKKCYQVVLNIKKDLAYVN